VIIAAEEAAAGRRHHLRRLRPVKWIQEGGVLDKSVMESEVSAFPEEVGSWCTASTGMIVPWWRCC
jgi:hypothetical protein